jgi:hypothetical protein
MLQEALTRLVGLFERVGLKTNPTKMKAMTCIPGRIRTQLSDDIYTNSRDGLSYSKEWKQRRVSCDHCGVELAAGSLEGYLQSQHNIFRSLVLSQDLINDRNPVVYTAPAFNIRRGKWECPFLGCIGATTSKWNLRRHFNDRHPMDLVNILGEGTLPKCEYCGMQTNPASAPRQEQSQYCQTTAARKEQHENAEVAARALEETFTTYGVTLERVELFKYLERTLRYDDSDTQATRDNLRKARRVWGRLSRVMKAENASPWVCRLFYKATVQAVLLFRSETWNITPTMRRGLEGFHTRAARQMTGMMPEKDSDGNWSYPSTAEVLEKAGLHTVDHYITVRRATILNFLSERPI